MSKEGEDKTKENVLADIASEFGGAAVRIIDLIGVAVGKGTSIYNDYKKEGKDKELALKISSGIWKILTKVKEVFNINKK